MNYLLFFLFTLFTFSCNSDVTITPKQNSAKQDGTVINGITTMTLDTFQKSTKTPAGIYQTMLPCADCKGIEHTVFFNPDLTFRMEENKWGKKNGFTKTEGLWRANEGKIFLYKNDSVKARYSWQGDTLQYLQPDGHAIALRKISPVIDNPAWQKKAKAGSQFYGIGTEPFWSVEVDKQKNISFHLAEWKKPMLFQAVTPVVSADSTVYSTLSDSATLRITILTAFCSDGMSDYIYNNKVKIVYKGQFYNGCGTAFRP